MNRAVSRREVIQTLGYSGLALLLNSCSTYPKGAILDMNEPLQRVAIDTINRGYPTYSITSQGLIGNFTEHKNRLDYTGAAGIDYAPLSAETEIIPIAAGVVVTHNPFNSFGGNSVVIYHGLGYYSYYRHLRENSVRVKATNNVSRDSVIALMGATGSGAKGITHLHLTFRGPWFASLFKLDNYQEKSQYDGGDGVASPWFLDADEFSAMGRHKRLYYPLPQDQQLDQDFALTSQKARKFLDEIFASYPQLKKLTYDLFDKKALSFRDSFRDVADLGIDKEILALYLELSKEKPIIPKADADSIIKTLEGIIRTTLKATAPIKNPKAPPVAAIK